MKTEHLNGVDQKQKTKMEICKILRYHFIPDSFIKYSNFDCKEKSEELKTNVLNNDLDVMGIVESGAAADNDEYFNLRGYQKFVLKHLRQTASSIIVFVKLSPKGKINCLLPDDY
ncbi:UNVERIFIED_CONTAM: hypothetical protein NCL1_50839 [Trichonephila clavipes]